MQISLHREAPPNISPSKRAFEKYRPWDLFSEFYGMLPTVSLFYWQRKPRGTLSMKRISRKSSKHKSLLKRVHRQMMKEQRSGLFENEEVRQWHHPLKNNHLVSRKAISLKIPHHECCISGTIKNNFTSLSKLIQFFKFFFQVISLSSRNEEESNDLEVDILC